MLNTYLYSDESHYRTLKIPYLMCFYTTQNTMKLDCKMVGILWIDLKCSLLSANFQEWLKRERSLYNHFIRKQNVRSKYTYKAMSVVSDLLQHSYSNVLFTDSDLIILLVSLWIYIT